MGSFGQNILSSLKYQFNRRTNNMISSVISISILLGFIWLYRQLAATYWGPFIKDHWQQRQLIYFFTITGVSILANFINMGVYYIVDKFKLLEQYKITKTGLLWEDDKERWSKLRNKAIKLNIINIGLIASTSTFLDSRFLRDSMVAVEIPSFSTILTQLFFCVMAEGILFYVFHKVGHLYLYKFHKVHHEFHVPTPLATSYFHPIDYILGVLIPFATGPKLLAKQMHIITLIIWIIFRVGEGHDGHSNYELPWSPFRALPFSTTSQYHSFHHTHNEGNYGSTDMAPDTAMYDNQPFFKFKQSTYFRKGQSEEPQKITQNAKNKPKRA